MATEVRHCGCELPFPGTFFGNRVNEFVHISESELDLILPLQPGNDAFFEEPVMPVPSRLQAVDGPVKYNRLPLARPRCLQPRLNSLPNLLDDSPVACGQLRNDRA
jgi:hypothetical protein